MEGSFLTLLEEHGSLECDQIAAHTGEPPAAVRGTLQGLRERGLVEAIGVGKLEGNLTTAVSQWFLTADGRGELARLRSTFAG